ncbi:MAG: phosphatidate cytidylyltransferase [Phycisphaeraceae bacterium]|nr:phosphatidate cytidylyltransferase [Phycisphaerae bacterium]MBX3392083.1 phosphatidate cytidylyltransferase [Phycisphaeraceae bacterium]
MVKRLLLGPVLIVLMLGLCLADERVGSASAPSWLGSGTFPPGTVIWPACLALAWGGALELARMLRAKGVVASRFVTPLAAGVGMAACGTALVFEDRSLTVAAMTIAATISLIASQTYYSRARTFEGALASAAGAMLAFVYLGVMFGCVALIRSEHPVWILVWVLLTTKSSDIGAYFTGRAIGQHKLIHWLSPGKTWEGLFGGTIFAGLVGWAGLWALERACGLAVPAPWTGGLAGMLFALVGQMGDLGESLFKRDAGLKDSGETIPGFGGFLDVLDSVILVAPVAYWWLRLVHPPPV